MKVDFEASLLRNIAGHLICCIICLLIIILSNYWLFTEPGDASKQTLYLTESFVIYGSRKAYILTIPSLIVLIIAGANMVDRIKIYRAYHQIKRDQSQKKPAKD